METPEFKDDVKSIQNRLMSPTMNADWKTLKTSIEEWMNETRRPWGSAIFYLLELGLKQAKEIK